MNDEIIKEILDFKENADYKRLNCDEIAILRDYITNLQQENERLKELDENYPIEEELAEAYRREEDYKSRIEKAVEILKNWHQEYNGLMKTNNIYISEDKPSLFDLRDVLNGRSDE